MGDVIKSPDLQTGGGEWFGDFSRTLRDNESQLTNTDIITTFNEFYESHRGKSLLFCMEESRSSVA
jgi:hypothetical protein